MLLVVVQEMDEGDGLAAVRGPLVQAARRVLLGGAAGDEVALEELDLKQVNKQLKANKQQLKVNKELDLSVEGGRGQRGAVGAEGRVRDGGLVVRDRHHSHKVIL